MPPKYKKLPYLIFIIIILICITVKLAQSADYYKDNSLFPQYLFNDISYTRYLTFSYPESFHYSATNLTFVPNDFWLNSLISKFNGFSYGGRNKWPWECNNYDNLNINYCFPQLNSFTVSYSNPLYSYDYRYTMNSLYPFNSFWQKAVNYKENRKPKSTQVEVIDEETEEYAVYSALITDCYSGNKILSSTLPDEHIYEGKLPKPVSSLLLGELEGLNQETINDYGAKNTQSHPLKNLFTHKEDYELAEEYGKGTLVLSRVGFNEDFDQALVFSMISFNSTVWHGKYTLLIKENGKWTVRNYFLSWIS